MMNRPLLLDLFCGAGGASVGYARAGFEVVGVDIHPQPNYPFRFIQADAVQYCDFDGFAAVHASPPCQKFSALKNLGKQLHMPRFDYIETMRQTLTSSGLPWIMENVVGAPLRSPLTLSGDHFGLAVRRKRLFESNVRLYAPSRLPRTVPTVGVYGDHPQISKGMNRAHTLAIANDAMGIDWMTWKELAESIPPAYTEWLGRQLLLVS